jgi:hypothetical protein
MIAKKSDGSQAKEKESTDSSTTIEDDEVKGKSRSTHSAFSQRDDYVHLTETEDRKADSIKRKGNLLRLLSLSFFLPLQRYDELFETFNHHPSKEKKRSENIL